jgi:hypothetical protein
MARSFLSIEIVVRLTTINLQVKFHDRFKQSVSRLRLSGKFLQMVWLADLAVVLQIEISGALQE